MQLHLQPAVDRFKATNDEPKRSEFREKLNGYVHLYSFLSQIISYGDPALEMLYSYGRLLVPHLHLDRDPEKVKIGDEVALEYYRLQRIYSGEITLKEGESEGVKSPTDVGTGKSKDEKAPLSGIIKILNEQFATSFTDEDRLFFEQIREKASKNPQVIQTALANPLDKFSLGIRKDRGVHDRAHERERQDRDPLHGRSGVPERGLSDSRQGHLRDGAKTRIN